MGGFLLGVCVGGKAEGKRVGKGEGMRINLLSPLYLRPFSESEKSKKRQRKANVQTM